METRSFILEEIMYREGKRIIKNPETFAKLELWIAKYIRSVWINEYQRIKENMERAIWDLDFIMNIAYSVNWPKEVNSFLIVIRVLDLSTLKKIFGYNNRNYSMCAEILGHFWDLSYEELLKYKQKINFLFSNEEYLQDFYQWTLIRPEKYLDDFKLPIK